MRVVKCFLKIFSEKSRKIRKNKVSIHAPVIGRCKTGFFGNFASENTELPQHRRRIGIRVCNQNPIKALILFKRIRRVNDTPSRIIAKIQRW